MNKPLQQNYYIDQQVAELLGVSLPRLRNKISGNENLPPRIEPPGCRHRLWPCEGVHEWLNRYIICNDVVQPRISERIRKRGRPTKAEQSRRNILK